MGRSRDRRVRQHRHRRLMSFLEAFLSSSGRELEGLQLMHKAFGRSARALSAQPHATH